MSARRNALALLLPLATLLGACGGGQRTAVASAETHRGHPAEGVRDDAHDRKVEQSTRWEKLGERMVDGKMDRDTIAVGRDDGRFKTLQLKVEGSALEMFDIVITFGDGSTFSPPTRLRFGNGTTSRDIDLPGDKRGIKKVELKYGNLPGGGRAQVEVWAR
ncbi:MAG: hypothetical protein HOO96_27610 [Polyangiaceae bacterium]|nr:hypothetical protein [Polyangiaceae bacterium]